MKPPTLSSSSALFYHTINKDTKLPFQGFFSSYHSSSRYPLLKIHWPLTVLRKNPLTKNEDQKESATVLGIHNIKKFNNRFEAESKKQ